MNVVRKMKNYFLTELSESEVQWSINYVLISWFGELGNGAIQTITGGYFLCIDICKGKLETLFENFQQAKFLIF